MDGKWEQKRGGMREAETETDLSGINEYFLSVMNADRSEI